MTEKCSYCEIAGAKTKTISDAAMFAIKITPTTSALSFRYFFASNEYNQSPTYNDTFALWVVQDFDGTNEKWNNIAKISEDRMPEGAMSNEVNIQNTCPNNRSNYKNNIPGIYKYNNCQNIGYLGCTEALDAEIDNLTPGHPVWVVMAVGDASDCSHDSAVFIKAKSIRFAKASDVSIIYDADGGTFSAGETKAVRNAAPDSSYTEFRYLSSNKKVATVTAGGKVKAKGPGSCTIYVFAKNGCRRKIKIKVKK